MNKNTKSLTLSALFLSLGFILPMMTGQVPVLGKALLPMHIPVFLCALICGWKYAFIIGLSLPLLRSLLFTVPVMYPTAIAVALEMATYALITGGLYRYLPKRSVKSVYIAMLPAMILGRLVRLAAEIILLGLKGNAFAWRAFFMGTILNATPGILLQLVLIPAVMLLLWRTNTGKAKGTSDAESNAALVDVYIATLPDHAPTAPIRCAERREEIASTANEKLRTEKHYVWQLLCYGLQESLGLCERDLTFTKTESGAWSVKGAEFSLSHSEGMLAVAVSTAPVGIDVERIRPHKDEALAARILTAAERTLYELLPDEEKNTYLLTCFTGKEAVFKAAKGGLLLSEIDTTTASLKTDTVTENGTSYVWSVATKTPQSVRVFTDAPLL